MKRYTEELSPEELKAAEEAEREMAIKYAADKFDTVGVDIDPEKMKTAPEEAQKSLLHAAAQMDEHLFDDLEADLKDDGVSLFEKVTTVNYKLRNLDKNTIIEAISKFTGMKLEEASEVYREING